MAHALMPLFQKPPSASSPDPGNVSRRAEAPVATITASAVMVRSGVHSVKGRWGADRGTGEAWVWAPVWMWVGGAAGLRLRSTEVTVSVKMRVPYRTLCCLWRGTGRWGGMREGMGSMAIASESVCAGCSVSVVTVRKRSWPT